MNDPLPVLLDSLVDLAFDLPASHRFLRCRHRRFSFRGREADCPCLRCGIDRIETYILRTEQGEQLGGHARKHARAIAARFPIKLDSAGTFVVMV